MSDWMEWRQVRPPALQPIVAAYELDGIWYHGHACKRGCCFVWEGQLLLLPKYWKAEEQAA